MELQLVNKEIAIQLKELGFDWDCFYHYGKQSEILENSVFNKNIVATHHLLANKTDFELDRWGNGTINSIPAPTQALVCKWLRVKYKITVVVEQDNDETYWFYTVYYNKEAFHTFEPTYTTYEQAEEAGILKAIEIIKKLNNES